MKVLPISILFPLSQNVKYAWGFTGYLILSKDILIKLVFKGEKGAKHNR